MCLQTKVKQALPELFLERPVVPLNVQVEGSETDV